MEDPMQTPATAEIVKTGDGQTITNSSPKKEKTMNRITRSGGVPIKPPPGSGGTKPEPLAKPNPKPKV